MNIVMYRMEDTERVRYQIRERRRREVRAKAAREEEYEKKEIERLDRNRKWREGRNGQETPNQTTVCKALDEQEERKQRNKEWRRRKESRLFSFQMCQYQKETPSLASLLSCLCECLHCGVELSPPSCVYQCREGHNLCWKCRNLGYIKARINIQK